MKHLLPQEIEIPSSIENLRRRRGKHVENGRDFVCECGKSYLSYSALYTHSKVKHGNKITYEQSLYTTANSNRQERYNFLDAEFIDMLETARRQYSLKMLEQFLQLVKKVVKEECARVANPRKLKINNVVFMEKAKKYWDGRDVDDEPIEEGTMYKMSIDKAMGYYLIKLEEMLQPDDFCLIQVFIMKIRTEFNDLHRTWRQTETTLIGDFPNGFNDIFLRIKSSAISDFFKENPTLTAMLFYHLNWWLWNECFTIYKLKLNVAETE